MSEDANDTGRIELKAADRVEGKAAGAWRRAGPINGEGNAIRQLFGAGTLDGGTGIVEACMNGPFADPNSEDHAPAAGDIVRLADVAIEDFGERAEQVFATRAHWIRVAVISGGNALDTAWWLR
ncbi:MAG: hypothetical protein AB1647_14365 [Pseudomonadota bacterium]